MTVFRGCKGYFRIWGSFGACQAPSNVSLNKVEMGILANVRWNFKFSHLTNEIPMTYAVTKVQFMLAKADHLKEKVGCSFKLEKEMS